MRIFSTRSALVCFALLSNQIAHANPYHLQYGGRITQANGQPLQGTTSVMAAFYNAATGGAPLSTQTFNGVVLTDGVFNITIELSQADFHTVFSGGEAWIEITDLTSGKIYPRQRFAAVPYAFKVPVDSTTIGYNANGQLKVQGLAGNALPTSAPADGQILKWRSATGWEWGSDDTAAGSAGSIDSTAIQDGSIVNTDIAANAAIAGTKVSPNFGSQNIVTTGTITGDGSGLSNLPASALGTSIESSEIADLSIVDADVSASAAIAQSKINGLTAALAAKEPVITAGTSAQYLRGDKTWSTLDTSAVPENVNLYYTDARARAAISVSAPLSYNSTTGVISMAAATSVANGYLSSGDWLSFNNKQAAITAASTVNAGSVSTALQKGLEIKPYDVNAGQTGEIRFNELSGSNYIGFKAPDALAADKIWTLPAADGAAGEFLTTDGSGNLSWDAVSGAGGGTVTSITAGTGLSGGAITTTGTINLANTAVSAGSYTRANITVDAQGRLTAAANGSSVNLASEVTGTLPLANGGTGAATAADARTNLGLGSLATKSAVATGDITDLTIVDSDISASAAIAQSKISGLTTDLAAKEPSLTAGTSAQFYRGDKSWHTLDTAAVPENTNLYFTDARSRAAVSGTAPVAYNSTTGAFSMAAATSVANGYLASGDWLTFNNKQAAISASSTVNTGTLTSALQNGVQIKPFGSSAGESGEIRFTEVTGAGSNFIGFKAPDSIAADKIWTLPAADGTNGQSLTTNGSGVLAWSSANAGTVTSITAGTGLSGGAITASGTIDLANTAVSAGSYTRANITVDAQGRLTAAASGSSVNLASEVTGTLPLANGGTGAATAADARTNLGLGSLATKSAVATGDITDLTIVDGDISASAAIAQSKISGLTTDLAGKEPSLTAGTSAQFYRGDKSWQTLDSAAVPENTNLYFTDARSRAAVSGTAPVAYNSTTGAFSMAAATSVANGYLSSGDWLTFNNKQAAISASSTVNIGTLTSALQNGVQIKPFGSSAGEGGELRFTEVTGAGSNFVGFKAPDSIAADKIWILPAADGTNGQFLSTNGSGQLSWGTVSGGSGGTVTSITAGTGLSGGAITASGTIDLANTAVSAGSYTRANITVDAQGRLTAAASGSSVNLASEVTGTLPLANGGTGAATAADARTNLGLGSLATKSAVATGDITDLTIVDGDISASAAIAQSKISGLTTDLAGKEPSLTAGTSAQFYRGDKSWQTLDSAAVPENTNLYFTDARSRAAVSGTAPVAYNSTTGAFSMAAATSVANGYLSSGDWLTFNNKQAAISASSTVNTGTLTSALQNGVQIKPFGSSAGEGGELRFTEITGAGTHHVGFKAPDSIAADKIWILPAADGTNGQTLTTNGSGVLAWSSSNAGTVTSITAGTGLSGGAITASGTIDLANTAVSAGSYTRANITVDAQGRLTAAANGSSVNLASEVTGTLPLANGGTGAATAADARTNLGLGSLATKSAVATGDITDLTIVDGDISASAAIAQSKISGLTTDLAGKEPSLTAGTSAQFYRGDKSWQTLDTAAVPENTNLYFTDARSRAAVSGTAPVAYNSTTGAFSMAAATSIANGYLASGDWLTFNNKQAAISASSTVNTGTLTSALQNGVQIKPFGSSAGESGELRFTEATGAGTNHIGFKAPDSIAADKIWTLPAADGTSGQALTTNGSGVLAWSSTNVGTVTGITAGTGLSGGTISSSGTIDLANTAVSAGSYTRANITVDAQGRLTAAANGSSVNLTSEVTGTLPVANGGTGAATLTSLGMLYGNGTSAVAATAAGAQYNILTAGSGGTPAFGQVALGQSAAVSGQLGVTNGGTGLAAGTSGGIPYFSASTTIASSAALTSSGVVLGGGAGAAPTSTAAGAAYQALRVPSGGGAPAFGALDISQSAAVTGVLTVANGGTNSSTALNSNRIMVSNTGAIKEAAALTNGQMLIGSTGAAPVAAALAQGSNAGVTITNGAGSITLDTAQDIRTSATPTFAGVALGSGSLAAATHVAGSSDASTTPVGGTLRSASGAGSNIAGTNLTITSGNGTGTGGSGEINFQTAPVAASSSTANTMATRMTIDKTGNVGIGTTAPGSLLDVASGDINVTYASGGTQRIRAVVGSGSTEADTGTFNVGIARGDKSDKSYTSFVRSGTGDSDIRFTTTFGGVSTAERMRIDRSGNVGIGSTSPGTALDVVKAGSTAIRALSGASGSTTDIAIGRTASEGRLGVSSANDQFATGSIAGDLILRTEATSQRLILNSGTGNATLVVNNSNVGIGTTSPSNTFHVVGSLCVKSTTGNCAAAVAGRIYATTTAVQSADLAENMPIEDESLVAGDIVTIETSNSSSKAVFAKSKTKNQANAIGVVSTAPGVTLGDEAKSSKPIALAGRVPVNVTLEGGPISIGDYLVASSTAGKAMRARSEMDKGIIGIALSAYNGLPIPAQDRGDGIAYESGHQVMMMVQNGAGSQKAVAELKARADRAEAEVLQIKTESAQLKLESAQLKLESAQLKANSDRKDTDISQLKAKAEKAERDAAQLKAESAQLKKFICTQFPSAEICSK